MPFSTESVAMTLLRRGGFEGLAWALRRFHTPVGPSELVLEVGAGGNPYPRANVLLDAYESTRERHWAPLVADRPTVLGFVENLPFRDQAFDFVIAAHVLEHSSDPSRFIAELQRVAKAGYIEVPDAFLERINPYRDHRLEITFRDDMLIIRKKASWRPDEEIVELYEDRVKRILTRDLIPRSPFAFHVRFYWENRIAYTVLNPDTDACWVAPDGDGSTRRNASTLGTMRERVRVLLRQVFSQRVRNGRIDLLELLRCPSCHGTQLKRGSGVLQCGDCDAVYPIRNQVPVMNEGGARDA